MTSKRLQSKQNKVSAVKCPTCKKTGGWLTGKFAPFCSGRCKLIDLGRWFSGEHAISEPLRPAHFEKYAGLPPGEHLDKPEGD